MSAEKLRKFIDDNKNLFGWEDTLLLNGVCNTLNDYEKLGKITAPVPEMSPGEKQTMLESEIFEMVKRCLDNSRRILVDSKVNYVFDDVLRLVEKMIDSIISKQRIDATHSMAELAMEYLEPKPKIAYGEITNDFIKSMSTAFPDPITRGDQGKYEKREELYKQHEEKLINSDDFLDETPDITMSSVGMLQKRLIDESGGAISMEVLCRDHLGNLKKVTGVHQVLFIKSMLDDDRFVLRVVTEARAGEPKADIGLLIS